MSTTAAVLALSLMSLAATWIGVTLAIRLRENARALAAGIGFSVGIMLAVSLQEQVPEAMRTLRAGRTAMGFALGAMQVWSAHLMLPHRHLVAEPGGFGRDLVRSVHLVVFGRILHNVPEEFAMAVPAVTLCSPRLLYGAAALSALAEPTGAILGLVATGVARALNGLSMAFAARAMVFASIHGLVPMARRSGRPAQLVGGPPAGIGVHMLRAALTL